MSQGASREVRADTLQLSLQPNVEARSQGPSGRNGSLEQILCPPHSSQCPALAAPREHGARRTRFTKSPQERSLGSGQAGSGGHIQNLELSTPGGGAGEEFRVPSMPLCRLLG